MKNKIIAIITFLFIMGFAGTTVYALHTPDYQTAIAQKLEEAKQATEAARMNACSYIGSLTQQCYAKRKGACVTLSAQEQQYQADFGQDSYNGCFGDDTPLPETNPTKDENPLFFGDEPVNP